MVYVLIRHKVADFAKWKSVYDAHKSARDAAGLKERNLLRGIDNPKEVVILFEAIDMGKARAFTSSPDLKAAMQRAGVVDKPDLYFLQ